MRLATERSAPGSEPTRMLYWWLAITVVGFFLISLSGDIERVTSPHVFGLQVILRKSYSVVAFGIVAYLLSRIRRSNFNDIFPVALALAGYSALIELAQFALGSHEGLYWNFVDVECGFVGGFLGCAFHVWMAHRRRKTHTD